VRVIARERKKKKKGGVIRISSLGGDKKGALLEPVPADRRGARAMPRVRGRGERKKGQVAYNDGNTEHFTRVPELVTKGRVVFSQCPDGGREIHRGPTGRRAMTTRRRRTERPSYSGGGGRVFLHPLGKGALTRLTGGGRRPPCRGEEEKVEKKSLKCLSNPSHQRRTLFYP